MRLSEKELKFFRNILVHRSSYRGVECLGNRSWEPWMEATLQKLTDELYPQEFDLI